MDACIRWIRRLFMVSTNSATHAMSGTSRPVSAEQIIMSTYFVIRTLIFRSKEFTRVGIRKQEHPSSLRAKSLWEALGRRKAQEGLSPRMMPKRVKKYGIGYS